MDQDAEISVQGRWVVEFPPSGVRELAEAFPQAVLRLSGTWSTQDLAAAADSEQTP